MHAKINDETEERCLIWLEKDVEARGHVCWCQTVDSESVIVPAFNTWILIPMDPTTQILCQIETLNECF